MSSEKKSGLVALLVGSGIVAWQLYELKYANHLTFWVVGILPIPAIFPGVILFLAGTVLLLPASSPRPRVPRPDATSATDVKSVRNELLGLTILLVALLTAWWFTRNRDWSSNLLWVSTIVGWLYSSAVVSAAMGEKCRLCGASIHKLNGGRCQGCGKWVYREFLFGIMMFALAIVMARYWLPARFSKPAIVVVAGVSLLWLARAVRAFVRSPGGAF